MTIWTISRVALLLVLITAFVGCQPGPDDRAAGLEPADLELVEELRIGSIDGPDALDRVMGILPLENGAVWVLQPNGALVFAADGAKVRTVGQPGQGPGEFAAPGPIGWWGSGADTVWIGDFVQQRVSLFSRAGDLVSSFPARQFRYQDEFAVQSPEAFLADGSALAMLRYRNEERTAGFPVIRYHAEDTAILNEVMRVDRTDLVRIRWGEHGSSGAHPITDAPIVLHGRDRIVVVDRTLPSHPESGEIGITVYDPTGSVILARRHPYRPQPLPASEADSLISARVPGFQHFVSITDRTVSPQEAERIYRAHVQAPAYRPPVRSAHLAVDGRIWLQWAAPPGEPVRWWILDASAEPEISFSSATVLDVRGVVGDYLWAAETDELEVPHLLRYRVTR